MGFAATVLRRRVVHTAATANPAASMFDRIRRLQRGSDNGSALAAAATRTSDVFRITVLGDALAGKEELVNALLDNQQISDVVSEKNTLKDALNEGDTVKVSYGPTFSKTANSAAKSTEIQLGLDWLKNFNTELVLLPSTASPSAIRDKIVGSDLTILVTNASAPLSAKSDIDFLEEFAEKPNLLVAVNSLSNSNPSSPSDIESFVSVRVADIASTPAKLPVFSVNAKLARAAQRDAKSPSFAETWSKSGVQDLKIRVLQYANNNGVERQQARNASDAYSARRIAHQLEKDADNTIELLEAVDNRLRDALVRGLSREQERLRLGFVESDLTGVGEKVGSLLASLRDYFRGVVGGVLGLVFRSDSVAADLEARVRGNSLSQAEYRMTYSIGKLNEGLHTLYARTRAELNSLASDAHPLSAYPTTKDLQSDITRIIDVLDKQAPAKNGGVEVDAFVLKNLVSSGFDVSGPVDEIQNTADRLVRSFIGSQLFFVTGGVFATYLGVPWAISIPSTALVACVGVGFYHFRWSAAQDRFISKVTEEQKTLESRLLDTYDREFTRVVSDPLASIVKMLSSAVEKRIAEAKMHKTQIQELIKEIDNAVPK